MQIMSSWVSENIIDTPSVVYFSFALVTADLSLYFIELGNLLGGSVVKNPHAIAGDISDAGSIPGLGRSP